MRSLAAESSRAHQAGPLEPTFYQEATITPVQGASLSSEDRDDFEQPREYTSTLDWFAVDLEGEHSAMDGRILEEHTEYVVYAIHRVCLLVTAIYILYTCSFFLFKFLGMMLLFNEN